ncbi:hypothetical protein [Aliihoeflea sp. PC F10.4]
MAGRVLVTALIGALVVGSFYFFGDVQAEPKARLALINPPIEAGIVTN